VEQMDNQYDNYIALENFEVKGDYDDEPPKVVKKGDQLLFSRKDEDIWTFVFNDRYIYIPIDIVTEKLKIHSDIYQEQFSHLDKKHLYFGQLCRGESFTLIENGMPVEYYKTGEYTTQQGVKYNAVKEQPYWEADKADKFNFSNMFFFKEDYLIEENYNFSFSQDEQYLDGTYNFMKAKAFKFVEPIKVCDYVVNHPRMLEVIECLFQGTQLNTDLKTVYTEYKTTMDHEENRMGGFFEAEDIDLPDLIEKIKENKQGYTRGNRYW
jgi:hypothetical protein